MSNGWLKTVSDEQPPLSPVLTAGSLQAVGRLVQISAFAGASVLGARLPSARVPSSLRGLGRARRPQPRWLCGEFTLQREMKSCYSYYLWKGPW